MKFKVKVEGGFKSPYGAFENGNFHDSAVLGIPEADVERWYRAGFVDILGRDPGPEARPGHTEVAPDKLSIKSRARN